MTFSHSVPIFLIIHSPNTRLIMSLKFKKYYRATTNRLIKWKKVKIYVRFCG